MARVFTTQQCRSAQKTRSLSAEVHATDAAVIVVSSPDTATPGISCPRGVHKTFVWFEYFGDAAQTRFGDELETFSDVFMLHVAAHEIHVFQSAALFR